MNNKQLMITWNYCHIRLENRAQFNFNNGHSKNKIAILFFLKLHIICNTDNIEL
jgi:hypothetical protein